MIIFDNYKSAEYPNYYASIISKVAKALSITKFCAICTHTLTF